MEAVSGAAAEVALAASAAAASVAGYAQLKGRKVPIPLIVNAINSGTSFMKKQPFFRKAASKATPKAVQAMKNTIETAWSRIYNEVMDKYGGR